MQSDFYIIGCGVCFGAAIGIALTVASQHASVWLPLAVGIGLAIAVAVRDRRHSGAATGAARGVRSSLPARSARADL